MKMRQSLPSSQTGRKLWARARRLLEASHRFFGTPTARWITLGIFAVQAVILVFATGMGTPPDEVNHIKFIDYYAHHSASPILTDQTPTYNLGDKTREVDYLYHYAMSLLVRVLPFSETAELHIVRLVSVAVGLLTFIVLAKLWRRLGVSAAPVTAALLVLTNLPMVLMMSSAINNDALVWLGAAIGMLLLVRLWERPTVIDLGWLVSVVLLGGLVKRTLLPLCVLFGLLGLLVFVRYARMLLGSLRRFNWQMALVAVVLLIGLGLFTERIGGNIVRYGTITPSCEQVDGAAACSVFWANIRGNALAQLPPEHILPIPVFVVKWFGASFRNVLDIQTQYWVHHVRPAAFLTPLLSTVLIAGMVYGFVYERRRYKTEAQSRYRLGILLLTIYFIVWHLLVNYGEYRKHKEFGLALNGRYILPGLLPLVGLVAFYWSRLLRRRPSWSILLGIAIVVTSVAWSGLLLMLRNPQLHDVVTK